MHSTARPSRARPLVAATLAALISQGIFAAPLALDIKAQPLAGALNSLASQSGLQIVYTGTLVADRQAPALAGQMEPEQALQLLLSGSGLDYRFTGSNTITLQRTATGVTPPAARQPAAESTSAK